MKSVGRPIRFAMGDADFPQPALRGAGQGRGGFNPDRALFAPTSNGGRQGNDQWNRSTRDRQAESIKVGKLQNHW